MILNNNTSKDIKCNRIGNNNLDKIIKKLNL
jgi:hypothetical protein